MKMICGDCEWFKSEAYFHKCLLNPPIISGDYNDGKLPRVGENEKCSQWLPKSYYDNPVIKNAWEDFLIIYKLSKESSDEIE